MKFNISLAALLLMVAVAPLSAQIKIGNNASTINSNSILELESTTKGFLAPRVALTSLTSAAPLTAPVPEGMLVYSDGGAVTDGFYYWNGTKWLAVANSTTVRSNYVLVKSQADLPAPVSGVITLTSGTLYEINGNIGLTASINLNGCTVMGRDPSSDFLNYQLSTGSLFTGTNGGILRELAIMTVTTGPSAFNLNALGVGSKSLKIENCTFFYWTSIGTIRGFQGAVLLDKVSFFSNTGGITYHDDQYVILNDVWWSSNYNTCEKFVGNCGTIQKLSGAYSVYSAYSGLALDITGVTSLNNAELRGTVFNGDGTYVNGTFGNQWTVTGTSLTDQSDTEATGSCYVSTSATTTFSAINTPVKLAGTTTSNNLFRFTSPANNRLTYTGLETQKFRVNGTVSLVAVTVGTRFTVSIAKNGTILGESKQYARTTSSTTYITVPISCLVSMAPNDYVEVWIENNTDASSVTASYLNLSLQ